MASEQLQTMVDLLRSLPSRADLTVEQSRRTLELFTASLPVPEDVTIEPVDAGGVPAEWSSARGAQRERVVLYLHGGGYCAGSVATHRSLTARIALASEASVLSIDYRLAPEHAHPAAVDDAVAAYRWLLDDSADPGRLVVAGDSAGGGLTIATLLALRDDAAPLPAAAVCLSPWIDLECTGGTMTTNAATDNLVDRHQLLDLAEKYVPDGDRRSPTASPVHADLTGLPPLLIQVGSDEALLDDAVRLADRAKEAGVDVTLDPWEGLIHVWQLFPHLPETTEAVQRIGSFIRDHTS